MKGPQTPRELLNQFKDTVKQLPVNERKHGVMLYSIYEQIVINIEEEEKLNDEAYNKYSESIQVLTTESDNIVEGKRKVTEEEISLWKTNEEPDFKYEEKDNTEAPLKSFWRKFIENAHIYHGEKDSAMLDHLVHIEISDKTDEKDETVRSLTVELQFTKNDFFENEKLTCKLHFKDNVPEKSEGTPIIWKQNPTIKKTTKTQKNKKTGASRTITKETQMRTFFEIFTSFTDDEKKAEELPAKGEEEDVAEMDLFLLEETVNQLNDLLPYALEYYLNVIEDEEDEEDVDEDEEDDEDDDDDEDEDPKKRHPKKQTGNKDSKKPSRKTSEHDKKDKPKDEGKEQPKPECKQQ